MDPGKNILVVDDEPSNIRLLGELLSAEQYSVAVARNGDEALELIGRSAPNLVLLDVVMPGLSGYEVCTQLRANTATRLLPIILVTGERPGEERILGFQAGADDFLTKPVNREELLARVKSLLRVEALNREIADWNQTLESRVQEQVRELERLSEVKNFLPRHVAEMVAAGEQSLLEPRRRKVTVCAIDLRGFTSFSETAEPEEIINVLSEYYAIMGEIAEKHGGTVEHFAGDGMVIFFNAPVEIEQPELAAVRASLEMQAAFVELRNRWRKYGHDLGFGIGISSGYATIGAIGFAGRWQYSAIGTVTNMSARLCAQAKDGQTLLTSRVHWSIEEQLEVEDLGEHEFRGIHKPVPVLLAVGLRTSQPSQ